MLTKDTPLKHYSEQLSFIVKMVKTTLVAKVPTPKGAYTHIYRDNNLTAYKPNKSTPISTPDDDVDV